MTPSFIDETQSRQTKVGDPGDWELRGPGVSSLHVGGVGDSRDREYANHYLHPSPEADFELRGPQEDIDDRGDRGVRGPGEACVYPVLVCLRSVSTLQALLSQLTSSQLEPKTLHLVIMEELDLWLLARGQASTRLERSPDVPQVKRCPWEV